MEIRKVSETDDFEEIANIYATSWKVAYQGIVPQNYLNKLTGSNWAPILMKSKNDVFVIIENKKYVGVSSVCEARDEKKRGWGEIISIYLLPDYFGKGYSKQLIDISVTELKARGFNNIYLWVLEDNVRARRFYEKNGFIEDKETATVTIEGKELKEIRYIRLS